MDTTTNHPHDELLASYSAGSLPLSQALCISAHLEHCEACKQKLQRLNRVGSVLMHNLEPSPASSDLKARVLAQLDSLEAEPTEAAGPKSPIPRCLHQFVSRSYEDLDWKRISADIYSVELCRDSNGAKVELLKIKPGGAATAHTHLGDEYTVILEGSFSDDRGLYQKGDFLLRDQNDRHMPVATQDSECICLAVTEGPIQFTGFFGRWLNPFIRRAYA